MLNAVVVAKPRVTRTIIRSAHWFAGHLIRAFSYTRKHLSSKGTAKAGQNHRIRASTQETWDSTLPKNRVRIQSETSLIAHISHLVLHCWCTAIGSFVVVSPSLLRFERLVHSDPNEDEQQQHRKSGAKIATNVPEAGSPTGLHVREQ